MKDVIKIWKEKGKILEGIKNNIFRNADVEHIAAERMSICETCPFIDLTGSTCMVPGTQPCCAKCGCSLALKTRALSAACDAGKWLAIVSHEEQIIIDRHLAEIEKSTTDENTIRPDNPHLQDNRE
jgi:hypothetical protein